MIHLRAAHLRLPSTCMLIALAACDPCAENPEVCAPGLSAGDGNGDAGDGQDGGMVPEPEPEPDPEPQPDPPPMDDCVAQFDECLAIGFDPVACSDLLDACLGIDPVDPEPPHPGPVDPMDPHQACWEAFDACLCDPYASPEQCQAELDACLNGCGPGEPPPPPEDPCLLEYEWCLQETGDPMLCAQILDGCQPPEPPPEDPCIAEYEACLEATGDPMLCEQILVACWG